MATKAEVLNDLALNRAGQLSARDLGAKYPEGISTVISEVGITRDDLATNTLTAPSAATTSPLTTGTSPTAADYRTATQQIVNPYEEEKLAAQLDATFSNQNPLTRANLGYRPSSLPSTLPVEPSTVLPTEKVLTPSLPLAPVSPLSKIGIPSLDANLLGTGETLRRNEGILSIGGRPGERSPEPYPTFDLQTAIRDQARAAEDEAARTGPGLAEQQKQVRNTFLDALQSQEGQGDGVLGTAANVASSGITLADKLGVPIHPLGMAFTLANTGRNFVKQREADKLIHNPNWLGTLLRSMGLEGLPFVDPTVPRGGGLPFHPTPQQSEILSTPPVTLPSKRQPVTRETLPPLPITDTDAQRKAEMFNRAQQLGRADPRFAVNVASDITGDVDDAPSYDPQSASFVDWDE